MINQYETQKQNLSPASGKGSNEILLVIARSIIIIFFPLFLSLLAYLLKFLLFFFLL